MSSTTVLHTDLVNVFATKPITYTWALKDFQDYGNPTFDDTCDYVDFRDDPSSYNYNYGEDFSSGAEDYKSGEVYSPEFPTAEKRYKLRLHANCRLREEQHATHYCERSDCTESEDVYYMSERVFIWLCNATEADQGKTVYCRISLVNDRDEKCHTQEGRVILDSNDPNTGCQFSISYCYLLNNNNDLLVDDTLTIFCEIYELNEESMANGSNKDSLMSISNDNHSLLDSGEFSDVILQVGGQEFKAHKAILATRSPVFAAMFKHDTKEKQESKVAIHDVELAVFQQLLRFIYTAKTPDLNKFARELLIIADLYQVESLKSVCGQYLVSTMNVESLADLLLFADTYNARELKSKCIKYFGKYAFQVKATEGWKKFEATKRVSIDKLVDELENQSLQ